MSSSSAVRGLPFAADRPGNVLPVWGGRPVVLHGGKVFFDASRARVVVGSGLVNVILNPWAAGEMLKVVPESGVKPPGNMDSFAEYSVTLDQAELVFERGALVAVFCDDFCLRNYLSAVAVSRL